jgi:hypothetical protein
MRLARELRASARLFDDKTSTCRIVVSAHRKSAARRTMLSTISTKPGSNAREAQTRLGSVERNPFAAPNGRDLRAPRVGRRAPKRLIVMTIINIALKRSCTFRRKRIGIREHRRAAKFLANAEGFTIARRLQNVLEQAVVLGFGEMVGKEDLSEEVLQTVPQSYRVPCAAQSDKFFGMHHDRSARRFSVALLCPLARARIDVIVPAGC